MPKSKKSDTSDSSSDSGPDDKTPPPAAKKSKKEPAKSKQSAKDKVSKSKKKETSESNSGDSNSGSDEKPEAPAAKKSKTVKAASNENGPWILEGYRQVRINEFRGRKSVDIREFYEKDGDILPGKKGICLSVTQWLKLLENIDEITAAVRNQ